MGYEWSELDVRWVGVRRKKSTQVFLGSGVLGVASASHSVNIWAFELILLFTSVDCYVLRLRWFSLKRKG